MITSLIKGLFSLALLFVFSFVCVVGFKVTYNHFKHFSKKNTLAKPPQKVVEAKPKSKRQNVRTIEIDTDLADKIYFKKSS